MKIRNSFISNSSSTSFIMALPKPIESYDYENFLKAFDLKMCDGSKRLFLDLHSGSELFSHINCELEYLVDKLFITDKEEYEVLKNSIKETIRNHFKKYGDNLYFKKYRYDNEMEFDIVPKFKGTVVINSEH